VTHRPTASTITDEQLDALYRRIETLERAEAALARVRHVADVIAAGAPWTVNHDGLARRIRDAAAMPGEQPPVPAVPAKGEA